MTVLHFLPEPSALENEFHKHSRLSSRPPKVWADAYRLAFASWWVDRRGPLFGRWKAV
jgi:hypothetical protein